MEPLAVAESIIATGLQWACSTVGTHLAAEDLHAQHIVKNNMPTFSNVIIIIIINVTLQPPWPCANPEGTSR